MKRETLSFWIKSASGITIILLIISIPLGLGMLLGTLAALYNYSRNVRYVDDLLQKAKFSKAGCLFFSFTSIAVMAIVFLIGWRFPHWVSIYTVALGLLWVKPVILVCEYRKE